MFTVADMQEANDLIVATCSRDANGKYYSRELASRQTLPMLEVFSAKLDRVHDILRAGGKCRCIDAEVRTKKRTREVVSPPDPPCSRCDGSGDDPEARGCRCDCCGGTGVEYT